MTWLSFLKSKLVQFLGTALLALSILVGSIQYGRKSQRNDDRVGDMENYIKTKKEIDNVETSSNRDAAFERLRRNGWLR